MSLLTNFEYIHEVRVRYADTDQMGVVYHGRYFEWFEAARTEMLRNMGLSYKKIESDGILMPVIEASCRYKRSVRYDELIQIKTTIVEVNKTRIKLKYEVCGEDNTSLRAIGSTVHCFINSSGRPVRASAKLKELFKIN